MALEFKCDKCQAVIITKYLNPHDIAKCPMCGADVMVPDDAVTSEKEPAYLRLMAADKPISQTGINVEIPSVTIKKPFPGIIQTGMLLLVYLCASFIFSIAATCAGMGLGYKMHKHPLFFVVIGVCATVVVLLYGYRRTGELFKEVFPIGSIMSFKWVPFITTNLVLIGFKAFIAGAAVILIAQLPVDQQGIIERLFEENIKIYNMGFWPMIIFAGIITPVLEELTFRGLILHGYLKRYSIGIAIVLSALVFALIHGNIITMIMAFIAGLFLAWLFLLTRSLLSCMLTHMIYNFIAVVAYFYISTLIGSNVPDLNKTSDMSYAIAITIGSAAIVVAGIYYLFKIQKRTE